MKDRRDILSTTCFVSASHPSGHGEGAHHLHQQDGRLPGVPEQRLYQLPRHQRQKLRDERPDTQRRRRVCEYWAAARVVTGADFLFASSLTLATLPPFFFLPPPCRTSLRFPSSIRPSGMAKSLSPTYPKSPARRGSVRSPSHSRVTIHIHPHPSHSFAKASVTDLPPHQLTFTL